MKAGLSQATLGYVVVGLLILAALGYGAYRYVAFADARLASVTADYEAKLAQVSSELARAEKENTELGGNLEAERERNDAFANQIEDISGTVGKLDKLSKTDPELLQKYSKVYFLNENYVPSGLTTIDPVFSYRTNGPLEFHTEAYPFLKDMLEDAADDDVDLLVISAFRSFGTQAALKSSYKVTYGAGANTFSADQGYSEHQLGTTLDFTTKAVGASFAGFQNTDAFTWLEENAHRYGFILSYPANNGYYQYEPWHWRFVGVDLARDLHKDGKHFYDLDQREIDTYLISIFE